MKLWIIKPIEGAAPWEPWYDKTFGLVVRAETEERARMLAANEGIEPNGAVWLDKALVTCERLTDDGPEEVIMDDTHFA